MARDEILTYIEMCQRERMSLQRGMNYAEPPGISIVLMSRRPNAPYDDELSQDGEELVYEGHDVPRSTRNFDPKTVDQPWSTAGGRPTENAKFAQACEQPEARVRVYEKLQQGIWSDKGLFKLMGYAYRRVGQRKVFKFHMRAVDEPGEASFERKGSLSNTRLIPGWVKQEVFKRDNGSCVLCGSRENLHFDHDLPYSRGGASFTPANVRILCAKHNLEKGARIE